MRCSARVLPPQRHAVTTQCAGVMARVEVDVRVMVPQVIDAMGDQLSLACGAKIGVKGFHSPSREGRACSGKIPQEFLLFRVDRNHRTASPLLLAFPQRGEAVAAGLRSARQAPGDVPAPAMPQLGRLNGRIPTSVLLRQPPEESLHLLFDICCIHVHAALLDPGSTPWEGYYGFSNPESYSSPYPNEAFAGRPGVHRPRLGGNADAAPRPQADP